MLLNNPPQNPEAERATLGAMLLNPDAILSAIECLGETGEAFFVDAHAAIYNAIVSLYREREPVDIITLPNALESSGLLEKAGGVTYIAELTDAVPTSANIAYYADIVYQKHMRRCTMAAASKAMHDAGQDDSDPKEVADNLAKVASNAAHAKQFSSIEHVRDILPRVMAQIEKIRASGNVITGLTTGIPKLDNLSLGLRPETINIIAARPSGGKSALAANIACHVSQTNPVLFISLEMRAESLVRRFISMNQKTPYKTLAGTFQPEAQQYRLSQAERSLGQRNIYIDDSGVLDVNLFRAKVRRFAAKHHPATPLFIIDYLQLCTFAATKGAQRYELIGAFTREAKQLANDLRCPMLLLCQLSREAEGVDDAFKCKSFLRESGNIEQDADMIMTVAPVVPKWMLEGLPMGVMAEDIINFGLVKNRDGEIGLCPLVFKRQTQEMTALADITGSRQYNDAPIEDTYDENDHGEF